MTGINKTTDAVTLCALSEQLARSCGIHGCVPRLWSIFRAGMVTSEQDGARTAAAEKMSEELEKKKKQLQEMRLRTLYNMVDNVTIRSNAGQIYHKRVLYLTRAEAFEFGLRDIPRVLTTLGITEHTLVIRFPRSMGGLLWFDRSERTKLSERCTRKFDEALEGRLLTQESTAGETPDGGETPGGRETPAVESLPRATVEDIFKKVLLEHLQDNLADTQSETGAKDCLSDDAKDAVDRGLLKHEKNEHAKNDHEKNNITRRTLLLMLSSCYAEWRGFLKKHQQYSQEAVVLMERQAAAERKLQSFMRNVLLPIAVRTNALFVVDGLDGACALGTTLQQCAGDVLSRTGDSDAPFKSNTRRLTEHARTLVQLARPTSLACAQSLRSSLPRPSQDTAPRSM